MSRPPSSLPRATQVAGHTTLFCVALLAVTTAIRSADPMPFHSWTRSKIHETVTPDAPYDTLFVGTSRMEFGLMPSEFDARSSELGIPTRTFNGALSGLRTHDVIHVLHWITDRAPASLRRVVMELHDLDQHVNGSQWFSDMQIEMHAPSTLLPRLASVAKVSRGFAEQMRQGGSVALHGLANALTLGEGARIVADRIAIADGGSLPNAWRSGSTGWRAVDTHSTPHVDQMRRDLIEGRAYWERALFDKSLRPTADEFLGGFRSEPFFALQDRLRARGIELVLVVMPTISFDFYGRELVPALSSRILTIECDRPAEHRPVFAWENFFDVSHLSIAGAKAFSRHLAELLAECDQEGRRAPRPRYRAPGGTVARIERSEQGLKIVATNVPLTGDLVAALSRRSPDRELMPGVSLCIELPAIAQCALDRTGLDSATGTIPWDRLPTGDVYWLQAGAMRGDEVLDLCAPIPIDLTELPAGSEKVRR